MKSIWISVRINGYICKYIDSDGIKREAKIECRSHIHLMTEIFDFLNKKLLLCTALAQSLIRKLL